MKSIVLFIVLIIPLNIFSRDLTGHTISIDGEEMYYTAVDNEGKHQFFKSIKDKDGIWNAGMPIESLNSFCEGSIVTSPFLTYDGQILYFSSNLPGSKGFDIYFSKKMKEGWSKPQQAEGINTDADELSPSLPAGNMKIYFARKKDNCSNIFTAENFGNIWNKVSYVSESFINNCLSTPLITPDGNTLLFSSDQLSEKRKPKNNIFYSNFIGLGIWSIPKELDSALKQYNEYNPVIDFSAKKMHIIRTELYKDNPQKDGYVTDLPSIIKDSHINIDGTTNYNGEACALKIVVKNVSTNKVVCLTESSEETGYYRLVLPAAIYSVEYIKSPSLKLNRIFDNSTKNDINFFDYVNVNLEIVDAISLNKMDAQIVSNISDIKFNNIETGKYLFKLPIGKQIDLEINKEFYTQEIIKIDVGKSPQCFDLDFSIKLKPDMRSADFSVIDAVTGESMTIDAIVRSTSIMERVMPSSPVEGMYRFNLRKDNPYTISLYKKGYMYFSMFLPSDKAMAKQAVSVKMIPLDKVGKMEMFYASFEPDSENLTNISRYELECIKRLIMDNPNYKISFHINHEGTVKGEALAKERSNSLESNLGVFSIPKARYIIELLPAKETSNKIELHIISSF